MLTDLVTEGPNVEPTSFRFLDLPFELRSQIIKLSITSNLSQLRKQQDIPRTRFETEPHDFTISAAGLKFHLLTSLNLFSVSRQIRGESMAIAFHNSSVCLQVEMPRYGGISEVATSISRNLDVLMAYPLLCDSAREVTVIFQPEPAHASGPFMETKDGGPTLSLRDRLSLSVMIGLIYCVVFPVFA